MAEVSATGSEIEQLKSKVAELELQNKVLLGYIQKMASHLNIEALLL